MTAARLAFLTALLICPRVSASAWEEIPWSDSRFEAQLQEPPPAQDPAPVIGKSRIWHLFVPVLAVAVQDDQKDKKKKPESPKENKKDPVFPTFKQALLDLNRPEYFTVNFGGVEYPVTDVLSSTQVPVRLAVLWEVNDFTPDHRRFIEFYLEGILKKELRPMDSYSLAIFDQTTTVLKSFSDPPPKVDDLFKRAKGKGKVGNFREGYKTVFEGLKSSVDRVKNVAFIFRMTSSTNTAATPDNGSLEKLARESHAQVFEFLFNETGKTSPLPNNEPSLGGLAVYMDPIPFNRWMPTGPERLERQLDLFRGIKQASMLGFQPSGKDLVPGSLKIVTIKINEDLPAVRKIKNNARANDIHLLYRHSYWIPSEVSPAP